MKIGGSTAWRSITQPISNRTLSDALVGLPASARDIHRASSPGPQGSQRQITLRGKAFLTSPSKRICPTPTWNGFRLARCFARGSIRQPTPASAPRTVPQPVSSRSQIDLQPRPGPVPVGSQCLLRLSATSALPVLQPRPGSLPFSGANASCDCLPPQRLRRECPAKTISRRDVSPRPRRRRGSLRSGAQPSSPAPFRRE